MLPAMCTLVLLALLGCGSTAPDPTADVGLRVLLVGNSLTDTHQIPQLVAGLSHISGGPRLQVSQVAFGGFNLEDHWARGDALDSIALGGWDFVVMQQGPSILEASRVHLIEWAAKFAERIRAAGARPAIYMVWPQDGNFDGVSRSYTDAARAIQGRLLPAGEAFRAVARDHPGHPNFRGRRLSSELLRRVSRRPGDLRPTDRSVDGGCNTASAGHGADPRTGRTAGARGRSSQPELRHRLNE